MTGARLPPKAASRLLRYLGCSPNNDAMLGDIQERFAGGKSRLWFWKEVVVAIIASAYVSLLSSRSPIMKRTVVWTIVLLAVFSLGFWTARSPFLVHEEMPTAEFIAEQQQQIRSLNGRSQMKGTTDFLEMEVTKLELEYSKTGAADTRAQLENLRHKLEQAQRSMQLDSRSKPPR